MTANTKSQITRAASCKVTEHIKLGSSTSKYKAIKITRKDQVFWKTAEYMLLATRVTTWPFLAFCYKKNGVTIAPFLAFLNVKENIKYLKSSSRNT